MGHASLEVGAASEQIDARFAEDQAVAERQEVVQTENSASAGIVIDKSGDEMVDGGSSQLPVAESAEIMLSAIQ